MEQVDQQTSADRLAKLIEVQNRITVENNEKQVGQVFEVLVEGRSKKDATKLQGYTRCFRMVHFEGDEAMTGEVVMVQATQPHLWGLSARLA